MKLKMLKGNHLTQTNRKTIKAGIKAKYFGKHFSVRGGRLVYQIDKTKKANQYKVMIFDTQVHWMGEKPTTRRSDYLIEIS